MASRLPALTRFITDRRAELEDELSTLEALETDRVQLRNDAFDETAAAAVLAASKFTSTEDLAGKIRDEVAKRISGNISEGLADTSEVARENALKQFLNETFVLSGLNLKSDPNAPEGLLAELLKALRTASTNTISNAEVALGILARMRTEPTGQRRTLSPTDQRLDISQAFLAQAQQSADRLIVNLGVGIASLSQALILSVRSNLQSALDILHPEEDRLARARTLSKSLQDVTGTLARMADSIDSLKARAINFQVTLEAKLVSPNADRAQASTLSKGIQELSDLITASRERFTDLAPSREDWTQTLAALIGISVTSNSEPARKAFQDPTLNARFTALKANLETVPDTPLLEARLQVDNLAQLFLGTDTSSTATSNRDTSLRQLETTFTTLKDRAALLITFIDGSTFATQDSIDRIKTLFVSSNLKEAVTALEQGDLAILFGLTPTNISLTDTIAQELQAFTDSIPQDTVTNLPVFLSEAFQNDILELQRNDLTADQDFEQSRLRAIETIRQELNRLSQLEGLITQADSL